MSNANEKGFWDDAEIISSYSRAQAIEDGVLVDLSAIAPAVCRESGYKFPIACTAAVWAIVDKAVKNKRAYNDLNGVLWDILWMSKACKRQIDSTTSLFQVLINGAGRQKKFTFKMMIGPGDDSSPVFTILFPEED